MAFCPNCGAAVADGAKFCNTCGTSLAAAAPSNPQQQSYQYQQPYGANPKYQKLGGWLLFFVIGWAISGVVSLVSLIQLLPALGTLFSYGSIFAIAGVVYLVEQIASLAVCVAMIVFVVQRNQMFLRYYQILTIANIALNVLVSIVAVIGSASVLEYSAAYLGNGIGTILGGVVGLIIMTLYFCKSIRVRTYMGSDEYLHRALFRFVG